MSPPEFGIGFDNPVYCQVWKQPALVWQGSIQQLLQLGMQWHLPLCCLRLQLSELIGLDQTLCLQPMAGHSLYTEPTRVGSSRYIYFNHVA